MKSLLLAFPSAFSSYSLYLKIIIIGYPISYAPYPIVKSHHIAHNTENFRTRRVEYKNLERKIE